MNLNSIPIWLLRKIARFGCLGVIGLTDSQHRYATKLLEPMRDIGIVQYDYFSMCWQLTERGSLVLEIMNLPAADRSAALLVLGLIPPEFDPTTTQSEEENSNG